MLCAMSMLRYVFVLLCYIKFDHSLTPSSAQQAQQRCVSTVSSHLSSLLLKRKAYRYTTTRVYIYICYLYCSSVTFIFVTYVNILLSYCI